MSKYKKVMVELVINTEDPLYGRLEAEAEFRGCTVDAVVDSLISVGSYWILDERLKALDGMRKMRDGYRTSEEERMEKLLEKVPSEVRSEWKLYTETRDGVPYAYRYGESWVAQQLLMEGGYKTPEEAVNAWLREWENSK